MASEKNYTIIYCNPRILSYLNKLPKDLREKTFSLLDELSQKGNFLDHIHTKTRCEGIFKIRVKSSHHCLRVFYTFSKNLYILHAYIKKDQCTRNKELDLALKRLKEIPKN
ncbi:type II toxin-antitoxin system RelE/ParE family toxin [Helicobacter cholecystus]|uniref:type II toxin-antitoxin system RelE/ParE family toxin n=1 Tax=Helicobacter cholecystus TaxID=45498 RepID=UPI0027386B3A|nr:type II toxin-antitoxin system RelE/ParE family toxin [Helicobacter cholecystus]